MKTGGPSLGNKSVLVVDDDEHTRNLLKDLCETAGYTVRLAGDGVEGLKLIEESTPDLVLLDLMMPRKDGFQVLRALREQPQHKELAVIILTAMGDMDGKIRGMELGADDYLTKPFKIIEFQKRVRSVLLVREYRERLVAAEEELSTLRALDPATGAGTYAALKANLDAEISRSQRNGKPMALLMLGLEEYQAVRYQLGRERFDLFLGELALGIRMALRGADRMYRLEIDELVLLLPETDLPGARIAGERILDAVRRATPVTQTQLKVRVGGAQYPRAGVTSGEELLREAHRSYRELRERGAGAVLFDA